MLIILEWVLKIFCQCLFTLLNSKFLSHSGTIWIIITNLACNPTAKIWQQLTILQDEYDDTYDDLAVGQQEPDSSEMQAGGRKFVLPVALGGGKIHLGSGGNRDASEEETSDEEENGQYGGGKHIIVVLDLPAKYWTKTLNPHPKFGVNTYVN